MAVSLVTGAAGFIGSHLTSRLLERGDTVIAMDNLTGGWRANVPEGANFVQADITTANWDLLFNIHQPTHIWHLAAYAAEGLSHWVREFNYRNNVIGSVRLINAAVKRGVERFVFTSSMAVYGDQEPPFYEGMRPAPEDPYGIAKFTVEQDLHAARKMFGLPVSIFRPHNVYGPGQNIGDPYRNVVGIFMRQAMSGQPLTIFGDGQQTRAFSYISDIVDPMLSDKSTTGHTFNIGGEQVVTIRELAEKVAALWPGSTIRHLPERYEVKHAWCDHTAARDLLGFEPKVDFDDGLRTMALWAEIAGVRWSQTPRIEVERNLPVFWRRNGHCSSGEHHCECGRVSGPSEDSVLGVRRDSA